MVAVLVRESVLKRAVLTRVAPYDVTKGTAWSSGEPVSEMASKQEEGTTAHLFYTDGY